MKFGDVVGVIFISAVVSAGVYLVMDHLKEEIQEDEKKDVNGNMWILNKEPEENVIFTDDTPVVAHEKKSIFGGFKKKVKETVVTKKFMNELENRDITITIDLMKGEKDV